MNMSTSIDDLPGPQPQPQQLETSTVPREVQDRQDEPVRNQKYFEISDDDVQNKIVKKPKTRGLFESIIHSIKTELNEENVLIFCAIFIATLSSSNEQTRRFLTMLPINSGFGYSHSTVSVVKCILLLIAIILIRKCFLEH